MENTFTINIKKILVKHFGENSDEIYEKSLLIQYINEKTRSANRGSKSRPSFGTLYALYTIIEDYIKNGFHEKGNYSDYEGAKYSTIFAKAKSLPFREKMQNHYFNNRTNSEFKKYFPLTEVPPIQQVKSRYWINENLLKIKIGKETFNISKAIIEIIEVYTKTKQASFQLFIESCKELQKIGKSNPKEVEEFISSLLSPNSDARLFEIVSYSILKYYYHDQVIFWGFDIKKLNKENLKLYKTGRTNANDGGIDFVMKPLGRFFQVTETLDFKKYFLDIDKIQKFPITFVIKSDAETKDLLKKIKENASRSYSIKAIIDNYMECIEEVINIPILNQRFKNIVQAGYLNKILDELVNQSKVEFNYADPNDKE